jgi:hypothetical protein
VAALAGKHAGPEVCDHFHAYHDGDSLMQWYDAFDLPLLINESITETSIQSFKASATSWKFNAVVGMQPNKPPMILRSVVSA